ncbi:hypothetical protein CRYUN_Cryun23aG0067400 [Craigia yunnanensis]
MNFCFPFNFFFQYGKTLYNELEVVEGMKLDRGYVSPYFITNQKNQKCELENPLILIHEKKISNLPALVKFLELSLTKQRPLLIVAEDLESEALATLILNKLRVGLKVCAIKAPGFGENRKASLQDLATLTGGEVVTEELGLNIEKVGSEALGSCKKVVTEELGLNIEKVGSEALGSCKKVTVSKDDAIILDGAGDKAAIEERCDQIRSAMESSTSDYDKDKLQERLAKLSGGVAVLKIGGASEAEVGEKKDRVTDALNATKAAVEEGIVPVVVLHSFMPRRSLKTCTLQTLIRRSVFRSSRMLLRCLYTQLLPMLELRGQWSSESYWDRIILTLDMMQLSVSSLMTTTEAIVIELPKDENEGAATPGGMGGLDY